MNILRNFFFYIQSLILAALPATSYVEGVVGQPQSFIPTQVDSTIERAVSDLIYRGVFKYDIYGATIPDLADTWTVSEDGLIYTIKLKDNQYWNNGKKITADDLIYTSFKTPELAYVSTDKIDELTVRYTLPNKYAPFLSLLVVGVMPVNAEEKNNPLIPVSSDDFRIADVERTGSFIDKIILVTTDKKYAIRKITFRFYPNEDELKTAAKLGEIDGFVSETACCDDLKNYEDYKYPVQGVYYSLYFNLRNEKLDDVELRRKMQKVLPIKDLVFDKGIPVQGPISRSFFTDKSLNFDKYDKEFSDDLEKMRIEIKVPNEKAHVGLAEEISKIWEDKLNLDVDVQKEDPETFVQNVIEPRDFEVLLYGQEVGRDPDRYVLWHSTQKDPPNLNISGFEQIRADRALEEGRNELDIEKRLVHYTEFQKVIDEQVPAIFLYHPYVHHYVSKYITGIGQKYTFTYWDRFLDFYNWKKISTN
ncbi:MAG TPA: ABC transporter substrate-binding protein [bacterium]|jgi:peptide/nickel transport system substrate-binding protein|nr:ABC transporter substrate-binding protein [bacterium]